MMNLILNSLDETNATNVLTLNVSELTIITEHMIFCTGRSKRNIQTIATKLVEKFKAHMPHFSKQKCSNINADDWIVLDFFDIIVHIMTKEARNFYQLEKLWQVAPNTSET